MYCRIDNVRTQRCPLRRKISFKELRIHLEWGRGLSKNALSRARTTRRAGDGAGSRGGLSENEEARAHSGHNYGSTAEKRGGRCLDVRTGGTRSEVAPGAPGVPTIRRRCAALDPDTNYSNYSH